MNASSGISEIIYETLSVLLGSSELKSRAIPPTPLDVIAPVSESLPASSSPEALLTDRIGASASPDIIRLKVSTCVAVSLSVSPSLSSSLSVATVVILKFKLPFQSSFSVFTSNVARYSLGIVTAPSILLNV